MAAARRRSKEVRDMMAMQTAQAKLLSSHLTDCAQKHQQHTDALAENTLITRRSAEALDRLSAEVAKQAAYLDPKLKAESNRALAFDLLKATIMANEAPWVLKVIAASLVMITAYYLGADHLVAWVWRLVGIGHE